MDHRPRPSSPYLPPGDEPAGWVVAGEEQHGWVAPPGNGWSGQAPAEPDPAPDPPPGWYATPSDPGYGGRRYGEPAAPAYPGYQAEPSYPPDPGYSPPEQSTYPPPSYPGPPSYPPPATEPARRPHPDARRLGRQRPPPPPDEPAPPGWTSALLWTIGAFLVPALVYLGWALTLSGAAPAGCLDAAGVSCAPPRTEAVDRLVDSLPALGGALTLALLVALVVRRIAQDWRGMTVGLAAAVIGAGLATLVGSVLS